ncbi:MAG: YbhB/YbcL family Raf kinase inhibitor-like protein [Sphingobium sp.]
MLEHLPAWIGALVRNVRAGHSKLIIVQEDVGLADRTIDLGSPAFANGARLPIRFTADGEGVSPPLIWGPVPEGTQALALIVEDPDAPALQPLVHALVWNLPPDLHDIPEGDITADGYGARDGSDVGRNSYMLEGWLPPDPPSGHGAHDYVFQLFALSAVPHIDPNPGRSDFVKAITGHVLAAGLLVGTYSRDEPKSVASSDPVGGPVPA